MAPLNKPSIPAAGAVDLKVTEVAEGPGVETPVAEEKPKDTEIERVTTADPQKPIEPPVTAKVGVDCKCKKGKVSVYGMSLVEQSPRVSNRSPLR